MGPVHRSVLYRGFDSSRGRKVSSGDVVIGTVVNFRLSGEFYLPRPFGEPDVSRLLDRLRATGRTSPKSRESAEQTLRALIRSAAARLRVPVSGRTLLVSGACPVVPNRMAAATILDPLSAMAVITQSTNEVWLRDREPRLGRISTSARIGESGEALIDGTTVREIALWVPARVARR